MNVLFACSRNQWRSRTAETIFGKNQEHAIRSAGTATDARIKVSLKLFDWSDMIFVMDRGHIVATGRHAEMVQQPGLYQELWQQQTKFVG